MEGPMALRNSQGLYRWHAESPTIPSRQATESLASGLMGGSVPWDSCPLPPK